MPVLSTNASPLFDADGDIADYAFPEADPVSLRTKFVTRFRRCDDGVENIDDLVYRAEWADGTWAEFANLPKGWEHILHDVNERAMAGSRAHLVKLDATLSAMEPHSNSEAA